jgi:pyrroline-5-carboxylate reductase
MKVGFIGTGKITSAITEGLSSCDSPPERIILSPRNRERADKLASKFCLVHVASDNQSVVEQSDVVFLALRPETAKDVLTPLRFSKDQSIISLIPTQPLSLIREWISPASEISRAVPLPSIAKRKGPILYCFPNPSSRSILEKLGDLVPVSDEKTLHVLWAMNGMISPGFDMMGVYSQWAVNQGVNEELARIYTTQFFKILAEMAVDHRDGDLSELSNEAATPGGLNEFAAKQMFESHGYDIFVEILNQILDRFHKGVKG